MSENNTHWRKILESEYLAGADLDDGNGKFAPIVLTIKSAGKEMVREQGTNKQEKCLIIHFEGTGKPMICNVTNAKAISKACDSAYIEEWAGHKIRIGTEKVRAFGENWDALRVKPIRIDDTPPQKVETVLCADCKRPIDAGPGRVPRELADATTEKYGRALCFSCAAEAKAASEVSIESRSTGGEPNGPDTPKLPYDV